MEEIVLVGSGGCMREIVWQIQELNERKKTWNIIGYVDSEKPEVRKELIVGNQKLPYLGDDNFLLMAEDLMNVVVCVGSSELRQKIVEKLKKNRNIIFPTIIMGNTKICKDVQFGEGCIVSMDARISTNVRIGSFVFINTGSKICHDGLIEDFSTLSPDVKLAGNVRIGTGSTLGIGTTVIQGISIASHVITGAGSVVTCEITGHGTFAGVPAKKLRG